LSTLMKIRFIFISCLVFMLAACGGGSSTSDETRAAENNFVGTQSITLSNGEISITETDNFTLMIEGQVVTVIDADFNATGTLNSQNQFVISSEFNCSGVVFDVTGEFSASR